MAANKRWFLVALAIFITSAAFGVVAPDSLIDLLTSDIAYPGKLAVLFPPFTIGTFVFILGKNILALLVSFVLSPVLCLAPITALVVNGWLIGFVLTAAVEKKSLLFALAGFLPHGILEIPAFLLGQAISLSFGVMVIAALFKQERRARFLSDLKQNLYSLGFALALLVPAAIIETYVTPLLIK